MSKTGYIYKLVSDDVEIKECYVGSTNNERVRKSQHKARCNNPKSDKYNYYVYQYIRENGGFQNWDMIRLEEFKYNDRRELHTRERFHMEQLKSSLNKQKPTRNKTEYYQDNRGQILERVKEYTKENKEQIAEYQKYYKNDNKEKLAEKSKEYRINNKEKVAKYKKEYRINNKEKVAEQQQKKYEKNKQKISERRKVKMTCGCGTTFIKDDIRRHEKSKKHKDYLTTPELLSP